jgi:hypothetical protein
MERHAEHLERVTVAIAFVYKCSRRRGAPVVLGVLFIVLTAGFLALQHRWS